MKIETIDKKQEDQENESIFENYDIILSKKEADDLVKRLEKGPNEKAKLFLEESIKFYKDMKSKEGRAKKKEL